jgi:hypothetical protein
MAFFISILLGDSFRAAYVNLEMAGYSETPLLKKLGLKPGQRMYSYSAPANYFDMLAPLPEKVVVMNKLHGQAQFFHLFVKSTTELKVQLKKAMEHMVSDGLIWVSWPKKASGVKTDLDENVIRDFGLKIGLVDIKVCAVDDVWSGLKFVIPLKSRK